MQRLRKKTIKQLIQQKAFRNQAELVRELARHNIKATQASISRDLAELGIQKQSGIYRLPDQAEPSVKIDVTSAVFSGDNLIVLRTGPGNASRLAYIVDQRKIDGIAGTLAGDDTVLLILAQGTEQRAILKKVLSIIS